MRFNSHTPCWLLNPSLALLKNVQVDKSNSNESIVNKVGGETKPSLMLLET